MESGLTGLCNQENGNLSLESWEDKRGWAYSVMGEQERCGVRVELGRKRGAPIMRSGKICIGEAGLTGAK